MQQLLIHLYQPNELFASRLQDGPDSLADYIKVLGTHLRQPEFESPPQDDRAVVVALSPKGAVVGWAINKAGLLLDPEHEHLEMALYEVTPPTVKDGVVLFAIHYAKSEGGDSWLPIPLDWTRIPQDDKNPLSIDVLVSNSFEEN